MHSVEKRGITDENVEKDWPNQAFVQIHGEVAMPTGDEGFHFKEPHSNVTTCIFDDTLTDFEYDLIGGGTAWARTITDEQAKELAGFIHRNIDKSFLIHCRAGVSRSGAVAVFVCEKKGMSLQECVDMNPYIHPIVQY
jgi:hypothetical protein